MSSEFTTVLVKVWRLDPFVEANAAL
jgi:hypothetical protein